jgi:triosephosphate isomerase
MVNKKLKACFSQNLIPIFCIGESAQERQSGKTAQVLQNQIREGLKGISRAKIEKLVIAYEPIWAISTTSNRENCNFEDALSMQILIRKIISELYNRQVSKKIRIIFGGNVRPDNALGYVRESRMGGVLVGGASLDAKEFVAISRKF